MPLPVVLLQPVLRFSFYLFIKFCISKSALTYIRKTLHSLPTFRRYRGMGKIVLKKFELFNMYHWNYLLAITNIAYWPGI